MHRIGSQRSQSNSHSSRYTENLKLCQVGGSARSWPRRSPPAASRPEAFRCATSYQPAEAAPVANLPDSPHYVKILWGMPIRLPHAFAELMSSSAATARLALDRSS